MGKSQIKSPVVEEESCNSDVLEIDLEIQQLIDEGNLVETFDLLPTAFILSP